MHFGFLNCLQKFEHHTVIIIINPYECMCTACMSEFSADIKQKFQSIPSEQKFY